jgi:hypothetical protein
MTMARNRARIEATAEAQRRTYDQAEERPSQCRKCLSTEREAFFGSPIIRVFDIVQKRPDGTTFTRLVKRRTKCKACGQFRFVLSYEHHPGDVADVT